MSLLSGDPAAPTVQVSESAMTRLALPTDPSIQPRFEFSRAVKSRCKPMCRPTP